MVHWTARRRDEGEPLRKAMYDHGTGLKALALRTQEVDPEGKGVSWQLCGFLATRQPWARDTTSLRTAELIEKALGAKPGALFEKSVASDREGQPAWTASGT